MCCAVKHTSYCASKCCKAVCVTRPASSLHWSSSLRSVGFMGRTWAEFQVHLQNKALNPSCAHTQTRAHLLSVRGGVNYCSDEKFESLFLRVVKQSGGISKLPIVFTCVFYKRQTPSPWCSPALCSVLPRTGLRLELSLYWVRAGG